MKKQLYFHDKQAYKVECDEDVRKCNLVRLFCDDDIDYNIVNTRLVQHIKFDPNCRFPDDTELEDMHCRLIKTTCQNCPKREVQR